MPEIKKQDLPKIFEKYNIKIEKLKPVATGKFNQTYMGIIKQNSSNFEIKKDKIILRIAPPDDAGFVFYEKNMMAREQKLHQIVKDNTSIPIPKIYVFDQNRDIIDRDFLLMEYISGEPMSEVNISFKNKKKIMQKTGKYLKELHENCKNDKFGYPQNIGMEKKATWGQAFATMWYKLIADLNKCKIYDKNETETAQNAFDKYKDLFERNIEASLLHMDIWTQNIMINNKGEITGIVDWDRAVWGDPEIEFAVLDYCGFNNADFWEGYGYTPDFDKEQEIRKKFYHLYEVQKYPVIWSCRDPKPARTEQYKKYSLEMIEKLLE